MLRVFIIIIIVRRRKRGASTTTTSTVVWGKLLGTRELGTLIADLLLLPARKRQIAYVVEETIVAVQKMDRRLLALQTIRKGVLKKKKQNKHKRTKL